MSTVCVLKSVTWQRVLAREISGGVGVGRKINDFIVPLYDKEYERLVAIAYRRTNDWALAQDLVQNTFLLSGIINFCQKICTICTRICVQLGRCIRRILRHLIILDALLAAMDEKKLSLYIEICRLVASAG